ncbi:hypothetical protein KO02_17440 [Sphingobacterium sp. ML3W]|uniref:hypothetical protein n=1 Tax=Sphingobacterium sp. ML3W TaxID=1538644 RepID=UPI0004F6C377|nr:hypothetical protein [Sphingobacterium sp. ML3W]AIM38268.1 hypothetical protein KO02_17440 [Sphingobacterium sp. ML3W]
MENLRLGIDWDIDQSKLDSEMNMAQKTIEGTGSTIENIEKKVNQNLTNLSKATEGRINSLRARIAQIQSDLAKWTDENSTLGLSINDSFFDKYRKEIKTIESEIEKLSKAPVVPEDLGKLPEAAEKASEALGGIGKSAEKVKESGKGAFKDLVGSLFSWNSLISVGITLIGIYGKDIAKFFIELMKGKITISQLQRNFETLNDVMAAAAKGAAKELTHLKVLKTVVEDVTRSTKQRKAAVVELQKTYPDTLGKLTSEILLTGQASEQYKELTKSILESARARAAEKKMEENAAKSLELDFKRQKVQNANQNEKIRYQKQGDDQDKTIGGGPLASGTIKGLTVGDKSRFSDLRAAKAIKEIDDEKKILDKTDEFLIKYVKVEEKVQKIKTKKTPSTTAQENLYDSVLKGRKSVLDKMDEVNKEYARKGMESDDAEMQALKDKFDKYRKIITDENEKIVAYNEKNKAKKGFKPVELLDSSVMDEINSIEVKAKSELTYKQDTGKLEKEIEKQKQVYADYEDYKSKLGKEKADLRYKDERKGFETFSEYMKSLESANEDAIVAVGSSKGDAGQENRVQLLKKESDEAKKIEEQKLTDLLALMVTYDQKRKNLIAEFETARAGQASIATAEELSAFDQKHVEELNQLDDANIQKLSSYKALFDGVDKLTDAGARKVIKDAESMLASGINVSPEMLKKIRETLKDAAKSLDERLPERVMTLSGAFGEMAQDIGRVNEELGSMLQGVSNVLRATVQIKDGFIDLTKGINNYQQNETDGGGGILGSISAIAGVAGPVGQIVSAVSGVVSGVVKFFGAAKESARIAEKQMKEYQDTVMSGEFEYNRLLRERAREHESINELTVEQIRLQQELLKLHTTDAETDFNTILKRIQSEGEQITGQKTEKHGGFLGIGKKTRVVDIKSGLAGYTYAQLEELYTSKKMTEATSKLFEELQKSKNEIDGLAESWDEAQSVILDKMSGGVTADSISSKIMSGLKEGKRLYTDFADDIHDVIQNALLSAMSATVLEEPLQELVKKFREDSKDGLTQDEIDAFKKGYGDIVKEGLDALKIIEGTYGTIGGTGSSSVKSEGVERMTEQSGAEFIGISRAHLDVSKQNLLAVQKVLEFEAKSYDQLVAQVRHLKAIEENTASTVVELKNVVTELKAIKDNTKGGYYVD